MGNVNLKFLLKFSFEIIISKLKFVRCVFLRCFNFLFVSEGEASILLILGYGFFEYSKLFFSISYYAV
jgi:hypothetical protein